MRSCLSGLLSFVFIIVSPAISLLAALSLSHITPASIKQGLVDQHWYTQSVNALVSSLNTSDSTKDAASPAKLLLPFVQKEITPAYLQSKVETLVDDTGRWAGGQTTTEPVISFSDIKQKLVKQNTKLVNQLVVLQKQYEAQRPQLEKAAQGSDPQAAKMLQELDKLDFITFINSDLTFPLGRYLGGLRILVQGVNQGLPVLCLIAAGLLFFIYLINSPILKFKRLGTTLLLAGIFHLICLLGLLAISHYLVPTLTRQIALPSLVQPAISIFIAPLFIACVRIGIIATLGLIVTAIVFYAVGSHSSASQVKVSGAAPHRW